MPAVARKQVTLSQIAELSGVSRPLVSAILGNRKPSTIRYSQETSDKVMRVAEMTGYRPNRTARSLRSERHGNIGVLTRRLGSISGPVMNLMQETASADYGQCLVLGRMIGENDPPGETAVFLRESFVDGIIVIDHVVDGLEQQIQDLGIPSVWLNTGVVRDGAINHDEAGGIAQALNLFWQQSREHTAILIPHDTHYSHQARVAAMHQMCTATNRPQPLVYQAEQSIYDNRCHAQVTASLTEFLRAHPHIDSVVLSVDAMAGHLYRAAANLHRTIPADIAVVGYNDSMVAVSIAPQLTSLSIDTFDAGRRAIHLLNQLINGTCTTPQPASLPYTLTPRESI